jgi:phenylalanyl-tRNA synthetase beta subunit
MMAELAGGAVVEGIEDCYPLAAAQRAGGDHPGRGAAHVLGMDVPASQMREILERLEFAVEDASSPADHRQ